MAQIFQHFRVLGQVTSSLPFTLESLQTDCAITVPLDKTYQVFSLSNLHVIFIGEQQQKHIKCIATRSDTTTYVATGSSIHVYRKNEKVCTLAGHEAEVRHLSIFGDLLLSVDEDNTMRLWASRARQCVGELRFGSDYAVTAVMHPHTYLNKALLGTADGRVELWNLRTQRCIFQFRSLADLATAHRRRLREGTFAPALDEDGGSDEEDAPTRPGEGSAVLSLVQAPAIDVAGIGYASGTIIVHNIRKDQPICVFSQSRPARALDFRSDGTPIMVSANGRDLVQWNLEERRLFMQTRLHDAPIVGLRFVPGQNILVTSARDNALKVWIFDQSDGSPRLLRSRSAHSKPPRAVRFFGDSSLNLLSAGSDRSFRFFNTVLDHQSCALSQKADAVLRRKLRRNVRGGLAPIRAFASCEVRDREWASIATIHRGDRYARLWRFESKALVKTRLQTRFEHEVTAVAMSPCGNFAALGSAAGQIDVCNVQSGMRRGGTAEDHAGRVTSLHFDPLNRFLVSTGTDGHAKMWDFQTRKLLASIDCGSPCHRAAMGKDAQLLAVALGTLEVIVIDPSTQTIVRRFQGHASEITDMTFSPDCRWLITASLDATVRVWDLPSARMCDWFRVRRAVTSLAFSANGEFLATAHAGSRGISLWVNKMQSKKLVLAQPSSEPEMLEIPNLASRDRAFQIIHEAALTAHSAAADERDPTLFATTTQNQLAAGLVTLSPMPRDAVLQLPLLDLIKQRNRPQEAPQAPPQAPFFLPTVLGLEPEFQAPAPAPTAEAKAGIGAKGEAKGEGEESHLPGWGTAAGPEGADAWSDEDTEALEPAPLPEDAATGTGAQLKRRREGTEEAPEAFQSRRLLRGIPKARSTFVVLLDQGRQARNYTALLGHLESLSPSGIDFALRMLDDGEDSEELRWTLDFIQHQLAQGTHFELMHAMLNVVLQAFSEAIGQSTQLAALAASLRGTLAHQWARMTQLYQRALCLTSHFAHIQL